MINQNRETLTSTGVHIGAMRRLGESYSAEEYLTAVQAAQDAGDGEAYATAVLASEPINATADDPTGADLHEAAIRILTAKGHGGDYTQRDYLEACVQAQAESSEEAS